MVWIDEEVSGRTDDTPESRVRREWVKSSTEKEFRKTQEGKGIPTRGGTGTLETPVDTLKKGSTGYVGERII